MKVFLWSSLLNKIIGSVGRWVGGRWVGGLVVSGWLVGGRWVGVGGFNKTREIKLKDDRSLRFIGKKTDMKKTNVLMEKTKRS